MIPLGDALALMAAVGAALFAIGWRGSTLWHREAPVFDDEPDPGASWPPPGDGLASAFRLGTYLPVELHHGAELARFAAAALERRRCMACAGTECPGLAGVDYCPSWQEAEARADRGEYLGTIPIPITSWVPPSERAALQPPPPSLDPDTDRMPTITELREDADYRVAWTELDAQMDGARRWYEETFHTGQFRAIRDNETGLNG